MRSISLALISTLLWVSSAALGSVCGGATGAICSGETPCCSADGHCGAGPLSCGGGCQTGFSGPGSCFVKPMCRNINLDLAAADMKANKKRFMVEQLTADNATLNVVPLTKDYGSIELSETQGLQMHMVRIEENGIHQGKGARLSSTFYMDYGTVTADMKMAAGAGVITSLITMSDGKDEIDFEWVGKDTLSVQTNYYYKGVLNYTNGMIHPVSSDLSANFHKYTISWTPESISWFIDGTLLRNVTRASAIVVNADGSTESRFPQEMSRVQLGIWDGGSANMAPGTREWAGTTDWTSPGREDGYKTFVKSLKIECQNPVGSAIDNQHLPHKKRQGLFEDTAATVSVSFGLAGLLSLISSLVLA